MEGKTENGNAVARIVKAAVAVLAACGVVVSPEHTAEITAGFLAIYGVLAGIQARVGK